MYLLVSSAGLRRNSYPCAKLVEDPNLNQSLMMKTLFVPDYLDCHGLSRTMVAAMQNLTEGAFPQGIHYLVTIRQVITMNDEIVSPVIIIAMVVCWIVEQSLIFETIIADVIYGWIIKYFLAFVIRKVLGSVTLKYY